LNAAAAQGARAIEARALKAAARLYHSYFTGLILTLVTRRSAADKSVRISASAHGLAKPQLCATCADYVDLQASLAGPRT
jgi:hypothetical protein